MKRIFFLCLFGVYICPFVSAQSDINSMRRVETTVEVAREVIPDKITVRVELSELASRGKVTLEQMEKAFADALNAQGVDMKNAVSVESQSLTSVKRGSYNYKTYLVVLSSAADVNSLFSLLEEYGIRTASISSTEYSKRDSLMEELRREAMVQSRKEAMSMAEAVSQTIGKAIYIRSDVRVRNDDFLFRGITKFSTDAQSDESPLADVAIKTLKFTQNVTVYYELK